MYINVKEEYTSPIVKVIKWFLKTYEFDSMNEERLKRVCSRLEEAKGSYICSGDELYLVREAFSCAKSEEPQDGITQAEMNDIYTWLEEEYRDSKRPKQGTVFGSLL